MAKIGDTLRSKEAIKSLAENAIEEARRIAISEQQLRVGLPPPPPFPQAIMPTEYSSALMPSIGDPDQYAALLQLYLKGQLLPFPSGVFKRRFYEVELFSLDPERRSPGHRKRGRPNKGEEARTMAVLWLNRGRPSFGKFALQLYRNLSATEVKKHADRLRRQVQSYLAREN